jgi:hypothetical protein
MVYLVTSDLTSYTTIRSKPVYLNNLSVTKAKLTAITTSSNSSFVFGLSNDGGDTLEEVSNNAEYTFINSDGQEVIYQIWGKTSGLNINKILVKIN